MATANLNDILTKAYAEEGLTPEDVVAHKGYISTGNLALDFILGGGIARGRIAELFGLSQSGKAGPLDSHVLTPTGYVTMGSLRVGDAVLDPEGHPSEVVGIFPQGEQDIYRLTFSDGSTCESTADHLWPFRFRVSRRAQEGGRSSKRKGVRRERQIFVERKVVPLSEMMAPSRLNSSVWRPVLDAELRSDLDFSEASLPVDPYLLGLLLGDGGLSGRDVRFTTADAELLAAAQVASAPLGMTLSRIDPQNYRFASGGASSRLVAALRELGLMGHRSDTKFVPESYKIASAKTRLAVLQGLLDTDAEACSKGGAAIFGSASRQLRDDVVWLARSLGFRVTVRERKIKGERVSGGEYFTSYSARICSRTLPLFRLHRKAEAWARRSLTGERPGWVNGVRPRVLVSVEFSRRAEAQCISVSAPSHLYVTDDFIPTHNTTTAAQACAQAIANEEHVLYVDFEQALDTLYLSALGVDVNSPFFHPYPAASLEQGMHTASQAIRTGDIALSVFDSVAAMTPRKIVDEDGESRTTAMERARLLGNELSKLNPVCARTGCAAVFINHERDVIETSPVRPGMPKRTTTPGGSGLKYYSSQRVQFKVIKQFKGERVDPLSGEKIQETHSVLVQALVTKNKLTKPMQGAQLYLVFGEGFSDAHAAMKVLEACKAVRKSGSFFYFPEELADLGSMRPSEKGYMVQGLGTILDMATAMPEWGSKLTAAARSKLNMSVADLSAKRVDDPDGDGSPPPEVVDEDPDEVTITEADVRAPAEPPALASSHTSASSDPITPASIGAAPAAPPPAPSRRPGPDLSNAIRLI